MPLLKISATTGVGLAVEGSGPGQSMQARLLFSKLYRDNVVEKQIPVKGEFDATGPVLIFWGRIHTDPMGFWSDLLVHIQS